MKKVIVFDLDDTLYEEITFVHSGFSAVAKYLEEHYKISAATVLAQMIAAEKLNRNEVFNRVLSQYPFFTKGLIKKCVSVYRAHVPKIQLTEVVRECLVNLAVYPRYLVTDGNKLVQCSKIRQLGLGKFFKKIFVTHAYGKKNAKPSLYCFNKICQLENVVPEQVVYIGDNPNKDFVNLKKAGYKTIRVYTGNYMTLILGKEYEADIGINSLSELTENLLNKVFEGGGF